MATPTAQDQLFLELVNRARLDPVGEAARFGIDLNQGLTAGTISGAQKQVLTFNLLLNDAAYAHSASMLNNDFFSHTGLGGSTPGQRMANAGYAFTGSWSWGENIAWVGTTGVLNVNASILQLHQNLFLSSGHRVNMLNANFKETGVSAQSGQFTNGSTFNAEMVTEVFAYSGSHNFVTGVAYHDTDNNDFYSVGEGDGGYNVELYSGATLLTSTSTWGSGGYSLDTLATGSLHITFSGGSLGATIGANFTLGTTNVKIDIVDGNSIQSSASATLTDAAINLMLLGINAINGTGNGLANTIYGNKGSNILTGLDGNDTLIGGAGGDQYVWNSGNGNDGINDASTSTAETDVLTLTNVSSTGVELNKLGNDLRIIIMATGEIITVTNQFNTAMGGAGIETLSFSGGVNWNRADITGHLQAAAPINGTAGADVLVGTSEADTVNGMDDNDTLDGMGGGDLLNGGNGIDTASYAISMSGVTVNLGTGTASGGHAAGDAFVSIENLQGSNFTDVLTGNGFNNRLDGGLGADKMIGGLGDDTYVVGIAADGVTELAGQGTDTVETSLASYSLAALAAVENLVFDNGALADVNFTGTGNGLNNRITGGTANDILNGGIGADTLIGNAGDDTYVVDNALDIVDDGSNAGTDTVQSAVNFNLSAAVGDIEKLTLTGTAAINGTGNGLANTITGNTGANIIEGKGGADILDGAAGADTLSYATSGAGVAITLTGAVASLASGGDADGDSIKNFENITGSAFADALTGDSLANIIDGGAGADLMAGGLGNDTYMVDDLGDSVTENLSTGGVDLVKSSVDFTLGANLENLTLTGSADVDATGNGLANILNGNGFNNRLDGGLGADKMIGGLGDDTYVVGIAADGVTELAGQGTDTVETSLASYSLAALAAVENLVFDNGALADVNFTGTGNGLNNRITGGTANDILNGGIGADTLIGNAGDDTYVVDNALDIVDDGSNAGTDTVQSAVNFNLSAAVGDIEKLTLTGTAAINGTGNGLANTITGNTGANIIEGKGGADILDGAAGADTLSYATSGAGVAITLTGAVASLASGGDADGDSIKNFENITGSAFADALTGDSLANIIDGGAGADLMAGGLGNDTYMVDDLGDSVTENLSTGGVDLVKSSVDFTLGANLENLTLTGSADIDATGNGLANILNGNGFNNRLDGGLGADKMIGGLGDDTYVVGIAADGVTELAGQGTDTVETSLASYSLAALAAVENLVFDNGALADVNFTGTGNGLNNRITGGTANDILNGGIGADTLIGNAGDDTLTGGTGFDTFSFTDVGFGNDKVTDYLDNTDHLSFALSIADNFDDFTITGNGTKSVTVMIGLDSIVLASMVIINLAADDFIFV